MSLAIALQLADGALPIGRFAHSLGLEAWLDANRAAGVDELLELVAAVVTESVAPLDGVATACAHGAACVDELLLLDARVHARKLSAGAREASTACGRRLAVLAPTFCDHPDMGAFSAAIVAGTSPGHLAVVSGRLSAAAGLDVETAVLLELRGAAVSLLSVAVRLGRLSASCAQELQRRLAPTLLEGIAIAVGLDADGMYSSAIELEIAQLAHRRREVRQFVT